jgi:lysophospholipase L1-like esterase
MTRLVLSLIVAAAAAVPLAADPCQATQITGTISNYDNSPFNGAITITWPDQMIRGVSRPAGSYTVNVRNGAVNFSLCASQMPYTVTYSDSVTHQRIQRQWLVPWTAGTAAPLSSVEIPSAGALSYTPAALDPAGKLQASQLPAAPSKQLWPTMLKWRAALANCNGAIAVLGDSIGHGAGASTFTSGWAWQLNNVFAPRCGQYAGGLYTVGNGDGYTFAGTWSPYTAAGPAQTSGTPLAAARTAGSGATAQAALPPGTIYDIWYYTDTDTASGFSVQVDGGAATTYGNATSPQPVIAKATISGLTYGPHTIKVTAPTTGNIHLLGISSEFSNNSGIQVYNVSTPSANTEYYNSAAKLSWLTQVPNLSLVIYPLGTNDVQLFTPAQTQANISATVAYIQANLPNVPILFVTEPPRQAACTRGPLDCQSDVDAILRTTAGINGYPFLSLTERWGSWANANAAGFMSDGIHPSTAGHADYNALVADFLAPIYTTAAPSATGTLTIKQGPAGGGLQVMALSGTQALATIGDNASGTGLALKYNKAINQSYIGPTGPTDVLYLQTNGSNRLKIDQNGAISVQTPASANVQSFSAPSGSAIVPSATNPGCTASYMAGKIWFDSSDPNNTLMKVCLSVNGTMQWVTK